MKKTLLSLAATLGLAAFSLNTNAQVFTIEYADAADTTAFTGTPATASMTTDLTIKAKIKPEAGIDSFYLTWQIISSEFNFPTNWSLEGFCDNITCRVKSGSSVLNAPYNADSTETITSDTTTQIMYPWISAPTETADSGIGVLKVELIAKDVAPTHIDQTDTLVYIIHKTTSPVSVKTIPVKDKRVALYPVPAQNELNIYTDKSLNATSVRVLDIAGRVVSTHALSTKELNVINTSEILIGSYIVNIIDNKGNVVAARKFVKN